MRDLLTAHEEHTITIKATEARQQFFLLLSRVVSDPSEVVIVEHKDLPGRVMLVGEGYRDYVRQLESLVQALSTPPTPQTAAFRLADSMTVAEDGDALDSALDALRTSERRRMTARFAEL